MSSGATRDTWALLPMDLYAMFGLFMLIGIVKKNGILQVDKTNELRRAGVDGTQRSLKQTTHACVRFS